MPVSGLLVTLDADPRLRREALSAIEGEPRIEIGAVEGSRAAIVVDTQSSEEDKQLWQWLQSLPGVAMVEVAMVGFE